MASDRITISAGGKDFVTSLSTLKSSGAGYFEALLGPTGRSMKGRTIPGLTQRPAAPPTRAVPRTHRREDGEDDSFTTMMLATMLARQRSAARTNLAAMAAIAHLAARR